METIKSVIGLGSKPEEQSKEPINGETGAGTAAEPYDAGNQEENPLDTTAASTKEPVNGVTGAGTATEPYDAGNKEVNSPVASTETATAPAPPADISESKAVQPLVLTEPKEGTAPTSVNGEVAKTEAPAESTKTVAPGITKTAAAAETTSETADLPPPGPSIAAAALADGTEPEESKTTALPKAETTTESKAITPVAAQSSTSEKKPSDTKIGSAGWFKNTISRRKSKTPPVAEDKEVKKEAKSEEKKQDAVVAAPIVAAAPVVAAESKFPPAKVTAPPQPAPAPKVEKAAVPEKDIKPKKERKLSRDLGSIFKKNPFKRDSKAGLEDKDVTEEKSKAPLAAGAAGVAGGLAAGEAIKREEKKEAVPATKSMWEPVPAAESSKEAMPVSEATKEKAVITEPTKAENPIAEPTKDLEPVTAGEPIEPAKEESLAPNVLAAEVPSGVAEPAAANELPPLTDAETIEEPAKVDHAVPAVEEPVPAIVEPTPSAPEVPVKDETPRSAAIDDEDLAPDEIAPGQKAEKSSIVPAITEPQAEKGLAPPPMKSTPRNPQGENLSAIPTAGGIRLGESAYVRRTSVAPPQSSFNGPQKALPVLPAESSKAKPSPAETPATAASTTTTTTTESEKKGGGGLQRRRSVLDKLKDKLKV